MIRIGTSGYSFDDWVGTVYPKNIRKPEMLEYYQNVLGFDTVEINYTYYTMPSQRTMRSLDRRTRPDFTFVIKAHQDMTHSVVDPKTGEITDNPEAFETFLAGVEPLLLSNKLGGVLAQFPVYFRPNPQALDYLVVFRDRIPREVPLFVEYRNRAWLKRRIFDFMRENDLSYVTVDEPKLPRLMPFYPYVTTRYAYFRFHGRNPNWFNAPVSVRYDYLYSDEELMELLPHVRAADRQADVTYVFFNNCHRGQAALNARRFRELLFEGS